MKYLVAFLVSLLGFSGMALGHDDYEYDYSCSVVVESSRSVTFGKRSKALEFCKKYSDDYCKVRQKSYQKWESQYYSKLKFEYTSYESWADSRYGAVKAMDAYFTKYDLFHTDFRHNYWYGKCYGDPKKHDDYDDGDDDYPSDPY